MSERYLDIICEIKDLISQNDIDVVPVDSVKMLIGIIELQAKIIELNDTKIKLYEEFA